MKQKYIKPTTKAFLIQVRHNLLQLSTTQSVSDKNYSNGTILSREGGSSWDDDDE